MDQCHHLYYHGRDHPVDRRLYVFQDQETQVDLCREFFRSIDGLEERFVLQPLVTSFGTSEEEDEENVLQYVKDDHSCIDQQLQRCRVVQHSQVSIHLDFENMTQVIISDMWLQAAYKERIHFCVVQQNDVNDSILCFGENSVVPKSRLKIMNISYLEAKGPTWARHLCETLSSESDWSFMTDSHMRFEYGWDGQLIENIFQCPRPLQSLITIYPVCRSLSSSIVYFC